MIGWLGKVEAVLQDVIEGTPLSAEVQPLDIVRQVEREIERNKKVFINDRTIVPHKVIVHLFAPTAAKLEEYEALFNAPEFRAYIEEHVKERRYTLLDRLRVSVQCHQEAGPEFGGRPCWVEFSWPQVGADPGEFTIVVEPGDSERVTEIQSIAGEVPEEAWLQVLEGDAYRSPVKITRREFHIGRLENVLDYRTNRVVRTNHLAFRRPVSAESVNHSISRQHATVLSRDATFSLHDDGSRNGSSVERNGRILLAPPDITDGIRLEEGDLLLIGRARVRFTSQHHA